MLSRSLSDGVGKPGLVFAAILICLFANVNAIAGGNNQVVPPPKCEIYKVSPNDGIMAMTSYEVQVASAFFNNDKRLEALVNDWNSASCVFEDGRPKLSALVWGYGRAFSDGVDWNKAFGRIQELKKNYPRGGFVALAEASYWINYAWNARGEGYASSVTPDGWKLFQQRMEKAEKTLIESKPYASSLPGWYEQMILVQSTLHRSELERDKTFLEGAQKFKTFFPIYFTMIGYLTPKWGGSWETIDNFVKWSVDNTRSELGDTLYARLYWSVTGQLVEDESLFKSTKATWPKMKKGFEDMQAQYPQSNWNLNNFAKFACQAGDKQTFLKLRKKIADKIDPAAWGKPSLDLCETKFGYQ